MVSINDRHKLLVYLVAAEYSVLNTMHLVALTTCCNMCCTYIQWKLSASVRILVFTLNLTSVMIRTLAVADGNCVIGIILVRWYSCSCSQSAGYRKRFYSRQLTNQQIQLCLKLCWNDSSHRDRPVVGLCVVSVHERVKRRRFCPLPACKYTAIFWKTHGMWNKRHRL